MILDIVNLIITTSVITFLFAIIFKILPDVKISWKNVRAGAFFTAILFMGGRYLIGLYIQNTRTASVYGAAGSIIIILLWVYFTSVILYLGAEFTQVYSDATKSRIEPEEYAVMVETKEKEKEVAVLPPQHPEVSTPGPVST